MLNLFPKPTPEVDQFKKIAKQLEKCSNQPEIVEQCYIYWVDHFNTKSNAELSKLPFKTEAVLFLKGLLSVSADLFRNEVLNIGFLNLINTISLLFFPKKDDINDLLTQFITSFFNLSTFDENSSDFANFTKVKSNLKEIFYSFLTNSYFLNATMTSDNLMFYWSAALNRSAQVSEIVFSFLTEAITISSNSNHNKNKPQKGGNSNDRLPILDSTLQTLMMQSLTYIKSSKNVSALNFICFCYRTKNEVIPLFEQNFEVIVDTIKECENGLCFRDLLFCKTADENLITNSFLELAYSNSPNLVKSLLIVSKECDLTDKGKKHSNRFSIEMSSFLSSIPILDYEAQQIFLSLINKKDIFETLFPPKMSKINCKLLSEFINESKNITRDDSILYLRLTVLNENNESLTNEFNNRISFPNLILSFLKKLDTFDNVSEYLSKICQTASKNAVLCVDFICRSFPPISFFEEFVKNVVNLNKICFLTQNLPQILNDDSTFTNELLKNEYFVKYVVENELFVLLRILAADGPHPIIDRCILSSSIPEKFSQNNLKRMVYNKELNINKNGNNDNKIVESNFDVSMIRIPSLIPFLEDIQFDSLFDLYTASSYLIENNFIKIDDPLFITLGVQYLTPELVDEILSNRDDILYKLASQKILTEHSVYQIEKNRENSEITFELPLKIFFKIEKFLKPAIIFSISDNFALSLSDESKLTFGKTSNPHEKHQNATYSCDINKWHELDFSIKMSTLTIKYDNDIIYKNIMNDQSALNRTINYISIGSTKVKSGSTFYVKINPNNRPIHVGSGILMAHYRGIYYFKDKMNIENRLFQKILEKNITANTFRNIFLSMLSFKYINLNKMRQVLLNQSQCFKSGSLINDQFLTEALILFRIDDESKVLNKILNLFVDYDLWSNSDCSCIINYIYNLLQICANKGNNFGNLRVKSFINFLFDIKEFLNKSNSSKYRITHIIELFDCSEYLIRFLENPEICNQFFSHEHQSLLIKVIPLKYLCYLENTKIGSLYINNYSISLLNMEPNEILMNEFIYFLVLNIPYLSTLVLEKCFWASIFSLLFQQKIEDYTNLLYADLSIKKEEIIRIILSLLPDLILKVENNIEYAILFKEIYNFIQKIIEKNIKIITLEKYWIEFSCLLRMNSYSTNSTVLPFNFVTFESQRSSDVPTKFPNIILNDYNFGKLNFAEIPNQDFNEFGIRIPFESNEPKLKNIGNSIKINEDHEFIYNNFANNEFYDKIFDLFVFLFNKTPMSENSEDSIANKDYLLKCIFSCGADSNTKVTMKYHQNFVFKYIQKIGIDSSLLNMLNETVLIGFWENNLYKLIEVILNAYDKVKDIHINLKLVSDLFLKIFYLETKENINKIMDEFDNFIYISEDKEYKECLSTIFKMKGIENIEEDYSDDCYKQFKERNSCQLILLNSKYSEIRINSSLNKNKVVRYDFIYFKYLRRLRNKLSENIRFLFQKRYNYYSLKNEATYYNMIINLPKTLSDQYQLVSTVHPFSPPILYVPYFSKCNCINFEKYPNYKDTCKNIFGAKEEKIPKILKYIPDSNNTNENAANEEKGELDCYCFLDNNIVPFTNYKFDETHYNEYFEIIFNCCIETITSVNLLFSVEQIECVLIKSKEKCFIVFQSKVIDDRFLSLNEPKETLLSTSMIDASASGYYGQTTLFFGHLVIFFEINEITISIPRIFCCELKAIEIWFEKGYSLFLLFTDLNNSNSTNTENNIDVNVNPDLITNKKLSFNDWEHYFRPKKMLPYSKSIFSLSFSSEVTNSVRNKSDLLKFRIKWINNRISSFAYLLILNFYADRSFANISQYFVMPWVDDKRDLSKAMGMQTERRAKEFREKLESSGPDWHFFGSLYSNPGIVIHFMMRVQPFTNFLMDLQNGFDQADRLFFDFAHEYESASEISSHNVEELLPELFMLPELYTNVNKIPMPRRMRGQTIDDVYLPCHSKKNNQKNNSDNSISEENKENQNLNPNEKPNENHNENLIQNQNQNQNNNNNNNNCKESRSGAAVKEKEVKNWVQFVWEYRKKLDDTTGLEQWIDLVFGLNSRGNNALQKENLFYPSTYGTKPEFIEGEAFSNMMMSFGQVPTQLFFDQEHPKKNTLRFSRWPLLTEIDSVSTQKIKTKGKEYVKAESDHLVIEQNGTYVIKSCVKLFEELNQNMKPNDSTGNYLLMNSANSINIFDVVKSISMLNRCCFSVDRFLFCFVDECGTIYIFRAICGTERKILSYTLISLCYLPSNFISKEKVNKVSVSSHLFLVCEVISNIIYCFQLNGTFIRKIECKSRIKNIMINDSYQSIFAVQDHTIEVFTINGTLIASIDVDDQILCSSLSLNDTSVYLTTGHKNSSIRLWTVDPKEKILLNVRTLFTMPNSANNIISIEVLSNGSAMFAMDEEGVGFLFASRGIQKKLINETSAICCAKCGHIPAHNTKKLDANQHLAMCESCGAYFCTNCFKKAGGTMCIDCLSHIVEYSEVIDDFDI